MTPPATSPIVGVVLQMRDRTLTRHSLLLPLGLVAGGGLGFRPG